MRVSQGGFSPNGFYSPLCLRSAGTDLNVIMFSQGALTESRLSKKGCSLSYANVFNS